MAVMALAAAGVGGGVVLGAISRPRSSTVAAEAGGGYRRAPGTVGILSVVVVAVAAGAAVGIHVALAQPGRDAALEAFGSGSRVVEVEAIVSGKVEPRAGGQRAFDASIRLIGADGGAISGWTDAAVRVSGEQVSSGLDVGARARMNGTSRPAYPGDRAVVQILAHEIEVVEPPTGILRIAADLRQSLVRAAAGLPGGGGELVPGLAVGDTSAVSSQTDADMKASSLSHLTAVSGDTTGKGDACPTRNTVNLLPSKRAAVFRAPGPQRARHMTARGRHLTEYKHAVNDDRCTAVRKELPVEAGLECSPSQGRSFLARGYQLRVERVFNGLSNAAADTKSRRAKLLRELTELDARLVRSSKGQCVLPSPRIDQTQRCARSRADCPALRAGRCADGVDLVIQRLQLRSAFEGGTSGPRPTTELVYAFLDGEHGIVECRPDVPVAP